MQLVVVSSLTLAVLGALDGLADSARGHLAIATRSLQAPPYFIRACPII